MYLWLKAAHVASMLLFVGGLVSLLVAGRVLGARGAGGAEPAERLRTAVRRWDRSVTAPALLATWGFGLWIAISGGWFSSTWFLAKLVLVLVLTGLHGVLAGRLRRLDLAAPVGRDAFPVVPAAIGVGCIAGIAVLAIVKPV